MRSRVIGLMTLLLMSSLSIVLPTTRFSEQPTSSPIIPPPTKTPFVIEPPTETARPIAPPPTKTPFVTDWPTKTPFATERPTAMIHPTDRPTKTLFPAMTDTPSPTATRIPVSTVVRTRTPVPIEQSGDQSPATAIPTAAIVQPISARPVVSNPSPTVDLSSTAPAPSDTPDFKPDDHTVDDHSTNGTPIMIAPVAIDLTSVMIAVAGLGLSVWVGLWQHRHALVRSYTTWARADLHLRSETERLARRDHRVVDEAWTIRLLNQVALAATGEALGIDQIDRVMIEPIPAIVGLGRHFERVVFTPAPPAAITRLVKRRALLDLFGDSLHGVRQYPIDALSGELFMTDDLAAAWEYLCDRLLSSPASIPLPRTDRWSITIVPSQPARRAAGALYRKFTGRR